jgi:hypothetical protein
MPFLYQMDVFLILMGYTFDIFLMAFGQTERHTPPGSLLVSHCSSDARASIAFV